MLSIAGFMLAEATSRLAMVAAKRRRFSSLSSALAEAMTSWAWRSAAVPFSLTSSSSEGAMTMRAEMPPPPGNGSLSLPVSTSSTWAMPVTP